VSIRVVTVVILALTFLSLPSEAQQTAKIPRVGFLAPQGRSLPLFDAFRQGLADLGYYTLVATTSHLDRSSTVSGILF
jgi:hypothetical protein